jgi:hypothetical protein
MTNIVGTIGDSFTGKIGVWFHGNVENPLTTPKTVYLKGEILEKFYTVTTGVININVPQTEVDNVSAHFSIYQLDGESEIIRPAVQEFDAIVPNLSSVEFSSLIPTGVVNNQLDTAALRIARIIADNPDLAAKVVGAPYPKGIYSNSTSYKYGDLVSYFGKNYICKSSIPIVGVNPSDTARWYELVITLGEEVAVIATADNSPYSSSWNSSLLAVSQNAAYDKIASIVALQDSDHADITALQTNKADLAGANFTGTVTVIDQTVGNNSSNAANTRYVDTALSTVATNSSVSTALALKANLSGAAFSGTVTVIDQTAGNNSSNAANTRYVDTAVSSVVLDSGIIASIGLKADLESPVFTGNPRVPTAPVGDNDTTTASTAFVQREAASLAATAVATSFGWTLLSVVNNYTYASEQLRYSKHPSNIIYVQGSVANSVSLALTTITTLPAEARPSKNHYFMVPCTTSTGQTAARIGVFTNGDISLLTVLSGTGSTVSFLALNFSFNRTA